MIQYRQFNRLNWRPPGSLNIVLCYEVQAGDVLGNHKQGDADSGVAIHLVSMFTHAG